MGRDGRCCRDVIVQCPDGGIFVSHEGDAMGIAWRLHVVLVSTTLCVALSALVLVPEAAATIYRPSATAAYLSSVPQVKQPTGSFWCWAACSEMVIRHFGGTATQADVV